MPAKWVKPLRRNVRRCPVANESKVELKGTTRKFVSLCVANILEVERNLDGKKVLKYRKE